MPALPAADHLMMSSLLDASPVPAGVCVLSLAQRCREAIPDRLGSSVADRFRENKRATPSGGPVFRLFDPG